MKLKVGDEVVFQINVGDNERPCWEFPKVQVIGVSDDIFDDHVLCYVPRWINIPYTFTLNRLHCNHYNVDAKFLGEAGCFIAAEHVVKHIPAQEGELCCRCGNFVRWAQPDPNGSKFTCRSCKINPY